MARPEIDICMAPSSMAAARSREEATKLSAQLWLQAAAGCAALAEATMRSAVDGPGNSERFRLADERSSLRGCFRTQRFEEEVTTAPDFTQVCSKASVCR